MIRAIYDMATFKTCKMIMTPIHYVIMKRVIFIVRVLNIGGLKSALIKTMGLIIDIIKRVFFVMMVFYT